MEIEDFIENLKKHPDQYLEVQSLEYIYHLLRGSLLTDGNERSEAFRARFFFWVAEWARKNREYEGNTYFWYQIILDLTGSAEEAVSLFYVLSDEFFKSIQKQNLL